MRMRQCPPAAPRARDQLVRRLHLCVLTLTLAVAAVVSFPSSASADPLELREPVCATYGFDVSVAVSPEVRGALQPDSVVIFDPAAFPSEAAAGVGTRWVAVDSPDSGHVLAYLALPSAAALATQGFVATFETISMVPDREYYVLLCKTTANFKMLGLRYRYVYVCGYRINIHNNNWQHADCLQHHKTSVDRIALNLLIRLPNFGISGSCIPFSPVVAVNHAVQLYCCFY